MNDVDTKAMVFVFGSNLSGIHGAGAAKYAAQHKGAVPGVGEGRMGMSYALPTKGKRITMMSVSEIQDHVDTFLDHARANPDDQFQVTQVGCGLGGHRKEDIAPMFEYAPENCFFDRMWIHHLPPTANFWGTFKNRSA